jgi:hypothetical protein
MILTHSISLKIIAHRRNRTIADIKIVAHQLGQTKE